LFQEIDGHALMFMEMANLKELGVKMCPSLKIYNAILQLKQQREQLVSVKEFSVFFRFIPVQSRANWHNWLLYTTGSDTVLGPSGWFVNNKPLNL
jgi:hypothetical protein